MTQWPDDPIPQFLLRLHPTLRAGDVGPGDLHAGAHRAVVLGGDHLRRRLLLVPRHPHLAVVVLTSADPRNGKNAQQADDQSLAHVKPQLDGLGRTVAAGWDHAKTPPPAAQTLTGLTTAGKKGKMRAGFHDSTARHLARCWICLSSSAARSGLWTSAAGAHFIPSAARCSVSSRTCTTHLLAGSSQSGMTLMRYCVRSCHRRATCHS